MKNPRFWIGIIISVVALALAFRSVDLGDVAKALGEANYVWLIPGLTFAIGTLFFRAVRWRILFYPINTIRLGRLFGILTVGYMISNLLPLRLGDFARAYLVGELEVVSKVRALSTVAVERVVDIISVLTIMLLLLPFVPIPGWAATTMWFAGAVAVVAIVAMLVASFQRHHTLAILERALRVLPRGLATRLHGLADSAIDGFSAINSPRASLQVVVWSAATWVAGGIVMWSMLPAFGLPSGFTVGMFLLAISAFGMVVPSSPGYVGVYHAVIIESLVGIFGADRASAASYAVVTHILLFVPPVLMGMFYVWKEPYTWESLLKWTRRPRPTPAEVVEQHHPGG